MFFAHSTIWLMCAQSLAAFDISKHVENGVEITPEFKQEGGTFLSVSCFSLYVFARVTDALLRNVVPFKCAIKPRSEAAGRLVMEACTM